MEPWELIEFDSKVFGLEARRGCLPELLTKFETLIGAKLPGDYRKFLLDVNGGAPVKHKKQKGEYAVVSIDWEGREPQKTDRNAIVDYLLVVEEWEEGGPNALTLFWKYDTFVKEDRSIPKGLIPIGSDPGGSLFLLDVAGSQPGAVFFWARGWHRNELDEIDPYHNVGFIAPTFSTFIEKIQFED